MYRQQPTLLFAPMLCSQLRGLVGAHLGAAQDGIEANLEPRKRDPSRMRLAFASSSQAALSVLACAMGLGVPVT
jgi:hypothetical protein